MPRRRLLHSADLMNINLRLALPFAALSLLSALANFRPASAADPAPKKINVLIVTGGHGYDPKLFFSFFDKDPDITYTVADQKKPAEVWDRDDLLHYNVVLLYDFQREMTDAQKARFQSLFDKGVGLIVLHHALLSYQTWPEYERIAGGKYLLDHELRDGVDVPESTYTKQMTDIDVKVVDKSHPITDGLDDFTVHDELYRGVPTGKDIHVLLTAEDKPLAWTRRKKTLAWRPS